jgi:hypothetical protein
LRPAHDLKRGVELAGLRLACYAAAQMSTSLAFAEQIVEIAEREVDTTYRLIAFDSVLISHLAQSLLAANDLTGAEAALQEGFVFVEQSGERCWLADLHPKVN